MNIKPPTKLPRCLEEKNLIPINENGREFLLHPVAILAWKSMRAQAMLDGIGMQIVSAYRSVSRQNEIIDKKRKAGMSDGDIFKYSAPAGFSEHHSGLAIDITTDGFKPFEEEFEKSEAFDWLQQHAGHFGFTLSYPRGNQYGIGYEPWHWLHHGDA
jgi:D-alanyl-D-alanine carboxypeptidase